eukprot:467875-Prorocentrum_minimum.AAC.1
MHRGTCVCEGLPMHPLCIARVTSQTACAHPHWGAAHWRPPPSFAAPAHAQALGVPPQTSDRSPG